MASLILLILLNGAVFVLTATHEGWSLLGPAADWLVFQPRVFWADPLNGENAVALFASTATHADIVHLGGNIIGLLMITQAAEERLGTGLLLVGYGLSGVVGNIAFAVFQPASPVGTVGASGAIAGLMGMALVTNRTRPVPVLVFPLTLNPMLLGPALIYFRILDKVRWRHLFYWFMPVYAPVALWLLIQGAGTSAMLSGRGDAVNYLAHVGGFVAGLGLAILAWAVGWVKPPGGGLFVRRRVHPAGSPLAKGPSEAYTNPWQPRPPPRRSVPSSHDQAGGYRPGL